VSTIVIGVDDSARSEDAIAFARRLAGAVNGRIAVVNAFPYVEIPSRFPTPEYRDVLREDARELVRRMTALLSGDGPEPIQTYVVADTSPARALHDVAVQEQASVIVVGSTHTGRAGRVLPGSTGERLLHGAPCAVVIVPEGYRRQAQSEIRRVGVAYDATDESRAALTAASEAARALGAGLEIVRVVPDEAYGPQALMGGPGHDARRREVDDHVQLSIDAVVGGLPFDVRGESVRLAGDPADQLIARSEGMDLMVIGSRGYGPLRAVLAGGVSGRVARGAHCPVIVVPRGVEAPLGELFGAAAAVSARDR
jgi:nucleotide-binding universal stress UspA family protein